MAREERWQAEQLRKLQSVALLEGLSLEELDDQLEAVDAEAAELAQDDPFGDDDPRNFEDRWLDYTFQKHLEAQGARGGVLTEGASPEAVAEMIGHEGLAQQAHTAKSASDLAGMANHALGSAGDERRFVRLPIDPRFSLHGARRLFLLVDAEQLRVLVEQRIVRDDEAVSDVVEPIAPTTELRLDVEAYSGFQRQTEMVATLAAIPLGGKWLIPGAFDPFPPGPEATNLPSAAYTDLFEIRGWRPTASPTRASFSQRWDMRPGVLLAALDGGDDAPAAHAFVERALACLKSASAGAVPRGGLRVLEPALPSGAAAAVVVAAGSTVAVERAGACVVFVVRGREAIEPGMEPMAVEPDDVVVMVIGFPVAVPTAEIVRMAAEKQRYDQAPVDALFERVKREAPAARPSLLFAYVAPKR